MSGFISRDEAYQELHDAGGCDATEKWAKGYDDGITEAIRIINEMPAADVAPAVHGRWIKVKHPYGDVNWYKKCSICDKCIDWQDYKYCPVCGAKMDESEEKEV